MNSWHEAGRRDGEASSDLRMTSSIRWAMPGARLPAGGKSVWSFLRRTWRLRRPWKGSAG